MSPENLPKDLFQHSLWNKETSSLWPISTFTLKRNLTRHPFPHKQTALQAQNVKELIKNVCFSSSLLKNPVFLDFSTITPAEKTFLFEYALLPEQTFEDKPHQGVILDDSKHFLIFINLEDHLTLQMLDCNNQWHLLWNTFLQIEENLGEHLDFAFSSRFGFLTSDLNQCGTALNIKAYLHLPATIECSESTDPFNFTASDDFHFFPFYTPSHHEDDGFQSDLMVIENKYRLGFPEETLLKQIHTAANRLIHIEKNFRSNLKSHPHASIKDLVSRCFGILLHSYQLAEEETLNALSMLKLGVDLEWIQGISDIELNELLFHAQKGPLTMESSNLSDEQLLHKRALFIHDKLKKASLTL